MRIGIDATCLPSALAGAGRYIHGIVRGLAAIDHDNEYFVFIKAHDAAHFNHLPGNMNLVRLPMHSRALRLFWQHTRAGAQAQKLGLTVWHGTHYTLPNFTHNLACVATFHDLGVFHHPQLYPLDKRVYFRSVMQQAARRAQQLVAVSEATTRDLRELLSQAQSSNDAQRVTTIFSGVEEKFFQPVTKEEKARVRNAYQLDAPFILFVGTFEKRKNLVLLLHAFQEFCRHEHGTHVLALAGQESNGSAEVKATLARLGLQKRVRLLGYVAEADLPVLYQSAELFVMPSLYEGFGFPLLEAMASGAIALAANNSSLRELAAHAQMLCEATPRAWAQKMKTLLFDKKLREELARHSVQHARQFCWKRSARILRETYERAALDKKPRAHHLAISTTANGLRHGKVQREVLARHARKSDNLDVAENIPMQGGFSEARSGQKKSLAAAIKKTLAYSDLFDYPLTAEEVHCSLIEHTATQFEVRHELEALCAAGTLAKRELYYCMPGREHCVPLRQRRRENSAKILQGYRGILRLIKNFPFIRTVALSGTLAFQNAKGDDDLDLFLIVEQGRLWTVYTSLVVLCKVLGRRRGVCLNCLLDTAHLAVAERNFFVAHQIAFLRPLSGVKTLQAFEEANAWTARFLPQMPNAAPFLAEVQAEDERRAHSKSRRIIETFLRWRGFNLIEAALCALYRRRIKHLTSPLEAQAVVAEAGAIKLFTNDHRFRIERRLEQRLEQMQQYPILHQQEEPQSYATL